MTKIVIASGSNVQHCLAAARRSLGLLLSESREETRSGGEDGLYRVTLSNGVVVECTIISHARTVVKQILC